MTMLKAVVPFVLSLGILVGLVIGAYYFRSQPAIGSIIQGQENFATSSAPNRVYGASIVSGVSLIRGTTTAAINFGGSLSQVVITGANTGVMNFYDATTTNINSRASSMPTSSILLASIPASAAAGTYTFDATYTIGLLVDIHSGSAPTSTILYR